MWISYGQTSEDKKFFFNLRPNVLVMTNCTAEGNLMQTVKPWGKHSNVHTYIQSYRLSNNNICIYLCVWICTYTYTYTYTYTSMQVSQLPHSSSFYWNISVSCLSEETLNDTKVTALFPLQFCMTYEGFCFKSKEDSWDCSVFVLCNGKSWVFSYLTIPFKFVTLEFFFKNPLV